MQPDLASRALAAALIDSFSLPQSFELRAGAVAAETYGDQPKEIKPMG
jgi:hypothetical protein